MQRLYWRPAHVSQFVHVLIALIAIGALLMAERFQVASVHSMAVWVAKARTV